MGMIRRKGGGHLVACDCVDARDSAWAKGGDDRGDDFGDATPHLGSNLDGSKTLVKKDLFC